MHLFIYQYLEIEDCSNCIISIISENEEIVSNIADKMKISHRRETRGSIIMRDNKKN